MGSAERMPGPWNRELINTNLSSTVLIIYYKEQYVFYILILMCTLQSIVHEEWTVEVFVIQLLRHHNIEEDMVQLLQVVVKFVAHYPHEKPNTKEGVKRIA